MLILAQFEFKSTKPDCRHSARISGYKNEFRYQPYTSHLGFDDRRHTSRVRHGIFLELRSSIGKISISICWRTFRIDRVEQTYLARIEQINGVLNAIAEVNPDAIEIALERDRERQERRRRG